MSRLKKIDLIICSLLIGLVYYFCEAWIHTLFFPGHFVNNGAYDNGFLKELLNPDKHELYMRMLMMFFLFLFGVIAQLFINRHRYALLHDPFTNALNSRGIEPIINAKLKQKNSNKGYIVLMKLRHLSVIQKVLGSMFVEQLVFDAVDRVSKHHNKAFIGGFRFSNFVLYIEGRCLEEVSSAMVYELNQTFHENFYVNNIPFHMDYNLGIAPLSKAKNFDELMNLAYKALSKSYEMANQVGFYNEALDEEEQKKLFFVGEFYNAIKNDEFLIYLQPKISLESNEIVAFEVLSRWYHPEKGLISPIDYITEAENSYAISWLTELTLLKSHDLLNEMKPLKRNVGLSFNLSAKDLMNGHLIEKIINYFEHQLIVASLITFEITESSFIHQPEYAIQSINKLSGKGFKISIDDFGTGYSAFSYFRDFTVNEIKIDKSFITGINNTAHNKVIVKNIVILAHELNATICAEGIETQEEYDCLKRLGCDIGQGYLWSKPLPYRDAITLLNVS